LHTRKTHLLGALRVADQLSAAHSCLERKTIGWIGSNFGASHGGHHAVLVHSGYHRVGAERTQRRQRDDIELIADRIERCTLSLYLTSSVDHRWTYEPIVFILGEDILRSLGRGPPSSRFQQHNSEVCTAQGVGNEVDRIAPMRCLDSRKRRVKTLVH
jgi:hypothetical protein